MWRSRGFVPFSSAGCRTENGEKLSSTQAEPDQAINSAVAYFPSISSATFCRVVQYTYKVEKEGVGPVERIWNRNGNKVAVRTLN